MRKKVLYSIGILFLIGIVVIGIYITSMISSGYQMYKEAVNTKSVTEVVQEVRSEENYVMIDQISNEYLKKVVDSEDKRFYRHFGIDPIAITRAFYNNLKAHSFVQGGSTITQQLAKNLYFSFDKKVDRKVAEVFVAMELERALTKDEILELYCNVTYFGENCVGLKEASNHYYGIEPIQLSTQQADALAYTLRSPNKLNPNVYQPSF